MVGNLKFKMLTACISVTIAAGSCVHIIVCSFEDVAKLFCKCMQ